MRPDVTRALLNKLYWEEGKTLSQIATILRMSPSNIMQLMKRRHIPRRKQGPRLGQCRKEK